MKRKFLTRSESALWLELHGYPMSAKTLAKYASIGGGPEYQRFGMRVLYCPEKLLEWAESRTSSPVTTASN